MLINACVGVVRPWSPFPVCPSPWGDWSDPELERLRRLERDTEREEEKERIRERLRRRGVPEHIIRGWPPCPAVMVGPCCRPVIGTPATIEQVLGRIR